MFDSSDAPWFLLVAGYYMAASKLDDEEKEEVLTMLDGVEENYSDDRIAKKVKKIMSKLPLEQVTHAVISNAMVAVDKACGDHGWTRDEAIRLMEASKGQNFLKFNQS